jgi:hypothetical protein
MASVSRALPLVALLVAGACLFAGCSTSDTAATALLIDPGHYSVYHCDGLQKRLKALQQREQDLSNLMARASEGGGGVLIGNLTYRADYENAVGEETVLRRTAAEKKCELPPPTIPQTATYAAPAPAAPTPTAYTAPPPATAGAPAPVFQSDQGIR